VVLLALRFSVPPTIILGGPGQPPYLWSPEMADDLRAQTAADASIYVAYSGAHVVYLSGRRSAIPYLFANQLFNIPGAYDALLATMRDPNSRPDYVLANPGEALGPGGETDRRFMDLLDQHYVAETAFAGQYTAYRSIESKRTIRPEG